ncbi:MAG: DUF262 domain-containing protein [Muribaculaceae bacterium]
MMNPLIYPELMTALRSRIGEIRPDSCLYPDKEWVRICEWFRQRHYNRWIQVYTPLPTEEIHYEYYGGYACLHLEGEYAGKKYVRQVRELKRRSREYDEIEWLAPDPNCISCIVKSEVDGEDDLVRKLHRLVEIFDKDLVELYGDEGLTDTELKGNYILPQELSGKILSEDEVSIQNLGIAALFNLPLSIPDYQRIYCWENKQIEMLWDSLSTIKTGSPYHLGTIILQNREGKYEIVGGQQRLVTMSLILWGLGYKGNIPLLNERFSNYDAIKHVKNAKAVVSALLRELRNCDILAAIIDSLRFSVIVINGDNLDLGYTFFSNQNSKGVKLTDYDLLKAHHLRYILSEAQAIHLAGGWTKLTKKDDESRMPVEISLGKHVYRLRKLLRKDDFNEYGHYVRDEFRSAPLMPDVPPFGERFDYSEPIQGGAHFFAFVRHYNDKFLLFESLPQVRTLREKFHRRHKIYATLAETILFAYFIKFGTEYLSEALYCIMSKLAEHRYMKVRALEQQVQRFAKDSNLVQFIRFSTSPTFFLASALESIRTSIMDYDINDGIRWDFYKQMCEMFASFNDITVAGIVKQIENEYK